MSNDDETVERVARALAAEASTTEMGNAGFNLIHRKEYVEVCWRDHEDRARAALSALPPRLSPELIAQLTALASRLTEQGEYEAVDLIDTVVARVSAMPGRFYWLIERSAPREFFGFAEGAPIYVCLIYGKPWTDKADEALRFSRREDATQYWHRYEARDPALRIVEHGDIPALPERELLREALNALTRIGALPRYTDGDNEAQDIARAALEQQKGEGL